MVYRGVLREPHPSCALTARVHRGVCIVPGTRLRCVRFWVFFLCIRLRLGIRRGVREAGSHESGQHNDPVTHVSSRISMGLRRPERPAAIPAPALYATVSLHILTAERIRGYPMGP